MTQHYEHTFGATRERSRKGTWFGETSLTGTSGKHTWVGGAAIQRDTFRSRDVEGFDYTYTTIGMFGQDDFAPTQRMTVSGSGRVDRHSEFGTFISPKLSALVRFGGGFTSRVSGGRGHVAPTPFTDETEAANWPYATGSARTARARRGHQRCGGRDVESSAPGGDSDGVQVAYPKRAHV